MKGERLSMSEKDDSNKKYKRSPALNASIILVFLSIVLLITLAMFVSFDEVTNRFEAGKVDIVLEEPHWDPKDGEETVPNTFIDKDPTIINKEETVETYVFLEVIVPYEDDPNAIIETAYQDNETDAGKQAYKNDGVRHIPYYKFIATGEKTDSETHQTVKKMPDNHYINEDELYNGKQEVNDDWLLLDTIDNTNNKTYTYVYAYVFPDNLLKPLIATGKTEYPLFNSIYVQNFRERKADAVNGITAFPDPARDYSIKINAYGIQANFLKPNNETTTNPHAVWQMLNPEYDYTETTP